MLPRRSFSRLLLPLAALVTLVQLAVPHGWMIGASDDGAPTFVPCPTASPELARFAQTARNSDAAHDEHSKHGQHAAPQASSHGAPAHHAGMASDDEEKHDTHSALASVVCDFAALSASATLPDQPFIEPLLPDAPKVLAGITLAIAPGRGLAAPPPPPTGPPLTA